MEITELRNKTINELNNELHELLREQFNLRMQKVTQGVEAKSNQFKKVRRNIARVKTIIHEKKTGE
ncbi:MAG TPA: 50S ribosomal protein L29 [Gammaproteobacteria bacterium]|nr:50S ribosomal protein L29 [Gammaproteobacteria bacterium]